MIEEEEGALRSTRHGFSRRILVYDTEARPVAFYGGDFVTKQITAAAWSYLDESEVHCEVLTKRDSSFRTMLRKLRAALTEADVVAGHYIRGFDLPLVNSNLFHEGMPLLPDMFALDTKGDLAKMHGISKSMENLGATLGLDHQKVSMNTEKWWQANTLTEKGIREARTRVIGDVEENKEMLLELQKRGALGAPTLWVSGGGGDGPYQP